MTRAYLYELTAACLVGALLLLTIPGTFFGGDNLASRAEATHLLSTGQLGIPKARADELGYLTDHPGQYFVERRGLLVSKYGVGNSLMHVPPLLVAKASGAALPLFSEDRRALLLPVGVYQAVLGGLTAWLLMRITRIIGYRPKWGLLYTLGTLCTTFVLYYLRAQTHELFQLLAIVGVFEGWCSWRSALQTSPDATSRGLSRSAAWLVLLVLLKIAYAPGAVALGLYALSLARQHRAPRATLLVPLTIAALGVAAFLVTQWIRFGAVFDTGYRDWAGSDGLPRDHFSIAYALDATRGFLVSPRFSIFVHLFPWALLAVVGLRRFARQFSSHALAMLAFFLPTIVIVFSHAGWRGEAAYGPRYFAPLVPVLCIPALSAIESIKPLASKFLRFGAWATIASSVALSIWLQYWANVVPFNLYYRIEDFLQRAPSPVGLAALGRQNVSLVHRDFVRLVKGEGTFPPFELVAAESGNAVGLTPSSRREISVNLFWLPDAEIP